MILPPKGRSVAPWGNRAANDYPVEAYLDKDLTTDSFRRNNEDSKRTEVDVPAELRKNNLTPPWDIKDAETAQHREHSTVN